MRYIRNFSTWFNEPSLQLKKIRWARGREISRLNIANIFNTENTLSIFDNDFYKDLNSRRHELEKLYWKTFLLSTTLTLCLGMIFFQARVEFNFLGVRLETSGILRELTIFFLATLTIVLALQRTQLGRSELLLDEWARARTKGTGFKEYRLRHCGLQWVTFENAHLGDFMFETIIQKIMRYSAAYIIFTIGISLTAISTILIFMVAYDVAMKPALPGIWSFMTIGYLAACQLAALLIVIMSHVPLPYIDYTRLHELQTLEGDEEELKQRLNEFSRPSPRERFGLGRSRQ